MTFSVATYGRLKFIPTPAVKKQVASGCNLYLLLKLPKHAFRRKYRRGRVLSWLQGPCLVYWSTSLKDKRHELHAWFREHLETSNHERLQSTVPPWQKRVGRMVYPSSGVSSDKNTPVTRNFNCAYGLLNCKRLIYYPIFLSIWETFFNPCKGRREFNIPSSFSRSQSGVPPSIYGTPSTLSHYLHLINAVEGGSLWVLRESFHNTESEARGILPYSIRTIYFDH